MTIKAGLSEIKYSPIQHIKTLEFKKNKKG